MRKILIGIIVVLLMFPLISSIGVANSYWDEKPLKLAPGETTKISLRLQNDEPETAKIEVTLNSSIAKLAGESVYEVPPGKVSVPVYIDVSIPQELDVGTDYNIYVSFKQIASGAGKGFFQVAPGITAKVPVEIVSKEESELYNPNQKTSSNTLTWIIVALAVLLAIFFAAQKKITKKK